MSQVHSNPTEMQITAATPITIKIVMSSSLSCFWALNLFSLFSGSLFPELWWVGSRVAKSPAVDSVGNVSKGWSVITWLSVVEVFSAVIMVLFVLSVVFALDVGTCKCIQSILSYTKHLEAFLWMHWLISTITLVYVENSKSMRLTL